jgi:hypothetical protein
LCAEGYRDKTCSNRYSRTAARSARCAPGITWVAGTAWFGEGELRSGRLSRYQRPRSAQSPHHRGFPAFEEGGRQVRPRPGWQAIDVDDVFDTDQHTKETGWLGTVKTIGDNVGICKHPLPAVSIREEGVKLAIT